MVIRNLFLFASVGLLSTSIAQAAPIILPGAPGKGVQELTPEEAIEIADTSYTRDDAMFMKDMIPHHQQAVLMAELVEERTCLLYTSPSPRDGLLSRMPSSA